MVLSDLDVRNVLESIPVVSSVKSVEGFNERDIDPKGMKTFSVNAVYEGNEWSLLLSISKGFPYVLPQIHIENVKDYPAFGHINWQGSICYKDHQGLVVDYSDESKVLTGCLMEALRTIHEHYGDEHLHDLYMEYEDYWESMPSERRTTISLIEHSGSFKQLVGFLDHKKEKKTKKLTFLAIHDQEWDANEYYWPLRKLKGMKRSKVLYIPLVSPVVPPSPLSLWECKEIVGVVEKYADSDVYKGAMEWAAKQRWNTSVGIIFSHPKPSGEQALWGCLFTRNNKAKHPLVGLDTRWSLEPILLRDHSRDYLVRRGGGDVVLGGKKVAVVGCGSVGGSIASYLAKSGVGELHLYDFDILAPENIYRHVLGGVYVDPIAPQLKAHSLSLDIMLNHPFTKVVGFPSSLLELHPCKDQNPGYDAIVVATGDFTRELRFNQGHHSCNTPSPVVYAWQDGFGVGGHCMCVTDPREIGCLECLYTRSVGFKPHPKTSFIKQGQTITKHIGGCGGVMTPYSYLDASQTALLAARATIDVLKGECENEIRSWKGSSRELEANGYMVSDWYEQLDQCEIHDRDNYVASNCKVCG